jgi:beta-hydroxyacyl-ACP dehydratase FabZ
MTDKQCVLNEVDITRILPHRYPFLLIDRILEIDPGVRIRALKNVTVNEPYFLGHFPNGPVMPGVLIVEAMAQAGGVLAHETVPDLEPRPLYYLVGVDEARFRQPVFPGDQLELELTVDKVRRGMWRFSGVASVAGKPVASAKIMTAPGGADR